jgi:hypothetical protein
MNLIDILIITAIIGILYLLYNKICNCYNGFSVGAVIMGEKCIIDESDQSHNCDDGLICFLEIDGRFICIDDEIDLKDTSLADQLLEGSVEIPLYEGGIRSINVSQIESLVGDANRDAKRFKSGVSEDAFLMFDIDEEKKKFKISYGNQGERHYKFKSGVPISFITSGITDLEMQIIDELELEEQTDAPASAPAPAPAQPAQLGQPHPVTGVYAGVGNEWIKWEGGGIPPENLKDGYFEMQRG